MDKNDIELEEILFSLKEGNKDNNAKEITEGDKLPLEPPKPSVSEYSDAEAEPENLVWIEGKKAKKSSALPKLKAIAKKIFSRQGAIAAGIAVLAVAAVFGGVKLYQYSRVAYLKPYEELYGVEYPSGIKKEFCDAYGQDQSLAGEILINDTNTDELVYSKLDENRPLLEKGSSIFEEQHNRAIALEKAYADLESIYSTPEGFLKASQEITFKTLFKEEIYQVVSAFYTNTKPSDDDGYLFPYNCYGNMTEESFGHYQDRIKTKSLYDTGYELKPEDYLLTLSVDSDIMPDFRFVIVCVKTKNVSKSKTAEPNEKIYYPQAWYDASNQQNPYFLTGKWYPEIYINEEKTETKQLTITDFIR